MPIFCRRIIWPGFLLRGMGRSTGLAFRRGEGFWWRGANGGVGGVHDGWTAARGPGWRMGRSRRCMWWTIGGSRGSGGG